jgi:signal transduction histidine kinase
VDLLEGLMRYLMAIPAALLATKSMVDQSRQARLEARTPLNIYFLITALGFGVYALTHLFVHPLNMIPARWLNSDNFMAITGFPIQVIRALAAILISYSLLRAAQLMEEERKTALFSAQQSQLEAMRQQEMLRRDLLTHTVHTQEEERARIARELHDETSQELSAFSLELAALRSMIKGQNSAIAKVDHLQNLSRQISQEIYRLVHDLRPAQLDDLGLVAALRYLIGQYHSNMNIDIALKVSGDVHRLAPMLETVLFRVAQEAITYI